MGLGGFEPPTSRTPSANHTKLDYNPEPVQSLKFLYILVNSNLPSFTNAFYPIFKSTAINAMPSAKNMN